MKVRCFFVAVACAMLASCHEGYVSADASRLSKYLDPAALKALIEKKDPAIWIIDVRPVGAYRDGHIPTAKSYPSSIIFERLSEIPRDKYLIIYCETGGRAQSVIRGLEGRGYTRSMNWGGYRRWPYGMVRGDR